MAETWCVVLRGGEHNEDVVAVFGPIDSRQNADRFASFVSNEIDPAQPMRLLGTTSELLDYYFANRKSVA